MSPAHINLIKTDHVRPDKAFGNSCSNRQCHKGSKRTRTPEPYNLLHLLIFLPQTFLPKHLLQKLVVSSVTPVTGQVIPSLLTDVPSSGLETDFLGVTSLCLFLWFSCPNRVYLRKWCHADFDGVLLYRIHCFIKNGYFVNLLLWRCVASARLQEEWGTHQKYFHWVMSWRSWFVKVYFLKCFLLCHGNYFRYIQCINCKVVM